MAKVKIQGHASGTGVLTVTAPNTSSDRTITLPDATGTLLNSDGDGSSLTGVGGGLTSATEQSTASGTGVTFSGIPSGTKLIIVSFNECSHDDANNYKIEIGDAGGLETTGYTCSGYAFTTSSTAIQSSTIQWKLRSSTASGLMGGHAILTLVNSTNNTWVINWNAKLTTAQHMGGGGTKSLSGELTQLKFAPDTGNFDNGAVNIFYM